MEIRADGDEEERIGGEYDCMMVCDWGLKGFDRDPFSTRP